MEQNVNFGSKKIHSFPILPFNNSDSYNSKFGISQLNANNQTGIEESGYIGENLR